MAFGLGELVGLHGIDRRRCPSLVVVVVVTAVAVAVAVVVVVVASSFFW